MLNSYTQLKHGHIFCDQRFFSIQPPLSSFDIEDSVRKKVRELRTVQDRIYLRLRRLGAGRKRQWMCSGWRMFSCHWVHRGLVPVFGELGDSALVNDAHQPLECARRLTVFLLIENGSGASVSAWPHNVDVVAPVVRQSCSITHVQATWSFRLLKLVSGIDLKPYVSS